MGIAVFPLGPLDTNCFVIHTEKEAVVVDPGGDPAEVISFLREHVLRLTHILCTHLHFDHTYGIQALVVETGASVYASSKDSYLLSSELGKGGMWGLPTVPPYKFTPLQPEPLSLLDTTCEVFETPGHTPGGLSFYFASLGAVFAGDTLFNRSVGRTDFPGGDQDTLMTSIRSKLFTLPEKTTVYSGHGMQTSIGDEKRNNPYASEFSL